MAGSMRCIPKPVTELFVNLFLVAGPCKGDEAAGLAHPWQTNSMSSTRTAIDFDAVVSPLIKLFQQNEPFVGL